MDAQDGLAATNVRQIDRSLPVKTAGTLECRVQDIRPVAGCEDNDTGVTRESVHLREDLIQGLLSLVVGPGPTTTGSAHSINLIDEDQARCIVLRLCEQVSHTARPNTDIDLHELRARATEERYTCLSSDSFGKQGLTCTRGPSQQHPLGELCTNSGELLRGLQELHNLNQLLLGLINASDIRKLDASAGLHRNLRPAPAHRVRTLRTKAGQHKKQSQLEPQDGQQSASNFAKSDKGPKALIGPTSNADSHPLVLQEAEQLRLIWGRDSNPDEQLWVDQKRL
mmetsp:Transcript_138959/g.241634  ORF Transcript_138959/g.241634 Transcript_138959/m.241634 type:complete len:282 (+) Transcript_138959:3386-4231(+)